MPKNTLGMFYDDLGEIDFRRFFDSGKFLRTGIFEILEVDFGTTSSCSTMMRHARPSCVAAKKMSAEARETRF